MAFSSASVSSIERVGNQNFQGLYTDIWKVTLSVNPASIAAGASDADVFTVPGIDFGDHIISYGNGNSWGVQAMINFYIGNPGVLRMVIENVHASSALDIGAQTVTVLIGRPAW